jgi:hypothetical protein
MHKLGHPRLAAAALAVAVGGLAWLAASAQLRGEPVKEGQPAPAVELPATFIESVLPDKKGAKTLSLADFKGKKNVVLWFYPKALTGG